MSDKKEQTISVLFALIGTLAILINLYFKGFSTENLLDAVKDLVGLLVTIAVFLLAYRISTRTNSYLEAGRRALLKLHKKRNDLLDGIKANSEKSDSEEENDKRNKYLFIKRLNKNLRSKVTFIPVNELEDGILDIRVSKGTLVNLGYEGTDEEIRQLSKDVADSILTLLKQKRLEAPGDFEIIENPRSRNTAIMIDFEEQNMRYGKYEKIIFACAEKALNVIEEYKK